MDTNTLLFRPYHQPIQYIILPSSCVCVFISTTSDFSLHHYQRTRNLNKTTFIDVQLIVTDLHFNWKVFAFLFTCNTSINQLWFDRLSSIPSGIMMFKDSCACIHSCFSSDLCGFAFCPIRWLHFIIGELSLLTQGWLRSYLYLLNTHSKHQHQNSCCNFQISVWNTT